MPANADGGDRFAKILADLYGDAAQHLIGIVADRLVAGIDQPGWAERKLAEILPLRVQAQRFVAQLADRAQGSTADLLAEAYRSGILAAGGPGVQAASPGIVATNRGAIQAYAEELAGRLRTTHTRILRTAEDIYRQAIGDTAGQAVTGVQTRREVAARAVARLAGQGVTGYVDSRGRNWELGSYVEMASRTTVGQAHLQGGIDRYQQQGRYLVIVSNAPEECRLCRPYEGRVLSLTGRQPTDGELGGHRFAGSLEQAKRDGLLHPNCRHSLDAFIPGLTRLPAGGHEAMADPEGDQLRQGQRLRERRVREAKRMVAAAEPFGDTEELRRARALLTARKAALDGYVDVYHRKRLSYRESLGAR
jgi:hypothetical protein